MAIGESRSRHSLADPGPVARPRAPRRRRLACASICAECSAQRSGLQTSRWSSTPTTMQGPRGRRARSGAWRPAGARPNPASRPAAFAWKRRRSMRALRESGLRPARSCWAKRSKPSRGQISTHGSRPATRTAPSASWARSLEGIVRRSFASRLCSCWPRKAKVFGPLSSNGVRCEVLVMRRERLRAGVVRWEEPRHPGPLVNLGATVTHNAPLRNTILLGGIGLAPSDGTATRRRVDGVYGLSMGVCDRTEGLRRPRSKGLADLQGGLHASAVGCSPR